MGLYLYCVRGDEQETKMGNFNFPAVEQQLVKLLQKIHFNVNPYIKDLKLKLEKCPSCKLFNQN